MAGLFSLNRTELEKFHEQLMQAYILTTSQGLSIDITRGKPESAQLDLANELLSLPGTGDNSYFSEDGTDCRNYGNVRGLSELISIFAPLLPAPETNTLALGNSSLELMHSLCVASMINTPVDAAQPWSKGNKFICPAPGYDRHFNLTQALGFDMISVPMGEDGPDVDQIEHIVGTDPTVVGMWLVPVYSNPTGCTISQEKVEQLASMTTAAPDFRIFWDNAYAVHSFHGRPPVRDLYTACQEAGNPNRPYIFASTSKITFPGSGVAFFASSTENIEWFLKYRSFATIGPDKLNQLRHAAYLKSTDNVHRIMEKQAELIRPKFEMTLRILEERLAESNIASWTTPEGGYFISLDVYPGTAKKVVSLAADLGVKVTPAGATYPFKHDPEDKNIRIAPSYVKLTELDISINALTICVLLAATEKLLSNFTD